MSARKGRRAAAAAAGNRRETRRAPKATVACRAERADKDARRRRSSDVFVRDYPSLSDELTVVDGEWWACRGAADRADNR